MRMRKPLEYTMYFLGNKKSVLRYIATLTITVMILVIAKVIITNVSDELNVYTATDRYFITISANEGSIIDKNTVDKIKALDEVAYVCPAELIKFENTAFAASTNGYMYYISKEGMEQILKCLKISYNDESIDSLKENDFIVAERVKKNKKLNKGDKLFTHADIKLKDTINTDLLVGFTPKEFKNGATKYVVIPKEGKLQQMMIKIKTVLPADITYGGENKAREISNKNSEDTFNIVKMIITIACAITTGVSTYLHYFSRRREIGILKALGYSDKKIIFRITKEIIISSIIALSISIVIIKSAVVCMNTFLAEPNGYLFFAFNISMLSEMFIIILAIMLFSIIPTWVLLKDIDKISLIEGRV